MFDVGNMTALVVGNPRLPSTVTEQWGWSDIPHAEQEAAMVAEMLQAKALVGSQVSSFKTEIIIFCFSPILFICQKPSIGPLQGN